MMFDAGTSPKDPTTHILVWKMNWSLLLLLLCSHAGSAIGGIWRSTFDAYTSSGPKTTEWRIGQLPVGRRLEASDFTQSLVPIDDKLEEGEVLFDLEYASVDAATRLWVDGGGEAQGWGFFSKLQKKAGDAMFSFGCVLVCVDSRHAGFSQGDRAIAACPMRERQKMLGDKVRKIDDGVLGPSRHLSLLGTTTGLTAYLAISEIVGIPQVANKTVYVSAAAGGVGVIACQLFKLWGAKTVVGSSGSDSKLGEIQDFADVTFNYKRTSIAEAMQGEKIDIFFDNVGGKTLDDTLLLMNRYGVVVSCGSVSQYSSTEKYSLTNAHALSDRSLTLRGFIITDFAKEFVAARKALTQLAAEGQLQARETVFSWKDFGKAHAALHDGRTVGKALVKGVVAPSPSSASKPKKQAASQATVASVVVSAGAELGRSESEIAPIVKRLVDDHWFDYAALKAASASELVGLGVPGRLASLIETKLKNDDDLFTNETVAQEELVDERRDQLPATAGADAIAAVMLEHGYCIVTGLESAETMSQLRTEMDAAGDLFTGTKGSWSGEDTVRNSAVVLGKSRIAQDLATHELTLSVVDKILSPYTKRFKLGVATRILKVPGKSNATYQAPRQVLHRDDYQFAASDWPYADGFRPEFLVGVMWAASDFTAANGATNVVPGSHLWPPMPPDNKRPAEGGGGGGVGTGAFGGGLPPDAEIKPGAMPAGSALFYLGSTLHGAGQHDGVAPARDGLIFIYYLGWVNNLLNWHFAIPWEIQKEMPEKLQDLLGFASDGTDVDHPWIKGPIYTLPYQGGPGTLASLTNAEKAGKVSTTQRTISRVNAAS